MDRARARTLQPQRRRKASTPVTSARAQLIGDELIHHGTQPGPRCACGHRYRMGESIAQHRGDALDVALTLHDAGVPDSALHEATTRTLQLAGLTRHDTTPDPH